MFTGPYFQDTITSSEGGTLTLLTDSYLGSLPVTSTSCHCKFANSMNLLSCNIFAVRSKAGLPLSSTGDVSNRWSICYLKEVFEKKCSCEDSVSDELYQVGKHNYNYACIDENVSLEVCEKYFTGNGWLALKDVVKTIKCNPIYYCGRCTNVLMMKLKTLYSVIDV